MRGVKSPWLPLVKILFLTQSVHKACRGSQFSRRRGSKVWVLGWLRVATGGYGWLRVATGGYWWLPVNSGGLTTVVSPPLLCMRITSSMCKNASLCGFPIHLTDHLISTTFEKYINFEKYKWRPVDVRKVTVVVMCGEEVNRQNPKAPIRITWVPILDRYVYFLSTSRIKDIHFLFVFGPKTLYTHSFPGSFTKQVSAQPRTVDLKLG